MNHRFFGATLLLCVAVLPPAQAARGVDRRFGDQGSLLFRTDFAAGGFAPRDVLPLPDGRFLVAGMAEGDTLHQAPAVGRLRADGSWDPTFGTNGIYFQPSTGVAPDGGHYDHLQRLSDGRIVAVGNPWDPQYRVRNCTLVSVFSADGAPDTAFGGTGHVCYAFPGSDPDFIHLRTSQPTAVTVDAADRVYVVGPAAGTAYGVVRLTLAAQPDAAYGNAGVAALPAGAYPMLLTLDASGRLLVAGYSYVPDTFLGRLELRRIVDNGAIDTTFGTNGLTQYTHAGQDYWPVSLVLDTAQRPVLGFSGGVPSQEYAYQAARYTADGAPDLTFNADAHQAGEAGVMRLSQSSAPVTYQIAALPQPDGRLLLLGSEDADGSSHPVPLMARLEANLAFDASFGTPAQPGIERPVPYAPAATTASMRAVARDGDGGAIVLGGMGGDAAFGYCGFLMRVLPDALFGDGFDAPAATHCPP